MLACIGLVLLSPVFLVLVLIGLVDTGSPLFFQERVGRHQKRFVLVKFRTMKCETSSVATHLVSPSAVTPFGRFLRRTKLDEMPQLWNVLVGDMSLVGPRPCLPNQVELIHERAKRGVFEVRPGITGVAQICGIDMSRPSELAEMDAHSIADTRIRDYLKVICSTLAGRGRGDRISE